MDDLCLRTRREIALGYRVTDPALAEHLERCAECARAADAERELDRSLRAAVAVEPPPELEERILMRQAFEHGRRRRDVARLAVAASVLLALGIGAGIALDRLTAPPARSTALGERVLDHVAVEDWALAPGPTRSELQVRMVLDHVGATLAEPIGDVTFVSLCPFGDGVAAHLVLTTDHGPVTVLLAPGERVAGAVHFSGAVGEGLLVPRADGAMALVGRDRATLERLAARLRHAILWGRHSA